MAKNKGEKGVLRLGKEKSKKEIEGKDGLGSSRESLNLRKKDESRIIRKRNGNS